MLNIKYLKSGEISEETIHKTIMQWVRYHPQISPVVLHFANEGKRSPRYGKLMKDLGLRPGVSDLFIAMGRHGYFGAWIELKTKKGILSSNQKVFLEDMERQNYYVKVCRSIDEGISTIKWYCLAR